MGGETSFPRNDETRKEATKDGVHANLIGNPCGSENDQESQADYGLGWSLAVEGPTSPGEVVEHWTNNEPEAESPV